MTSIQATIAAEVKRLAAFYGVDGPAFDAAMQPLFFDAYTEIILGRDGFEVLVGAVGARDRLTELAARLRVQAATVRLFRAFSRSFPGRIGYLKLGFGPHPAAPTMHCGAIAPWPEVFAFMDEQPEFARAAAALSEVGDAHPLCHLVGFSADRESGAPIMKLYWLLDQSPGCATPMLASARVSNGTVRSESKRYFMGTRWDAAAIDERWRRIVDVARREFTDSAWLCTSDLLVRETIRERKLYVFRYDSRVLPRGMSSAFNLYYAEGLHHLQRGDLEQATRSFSNAVAFQPDHAHAYNNRGFCWIQKGEYWRAISDCTRARLYDGTIATRNLEYAQARVTREMATPEWLDFERTLVTGTVPLEEDRGAREPDLLDLRDGAAMLAALTEPGSLTSESALSFPLVPSSKLVLQPNEGDGDCLFQALSRGELEDDALTRLRAQVAAIRLQLPEDPRGNTLRVLAALLQTPATKERGLALAAEGAVGLRNEVCAALQAVRGIYAGEPEIEQWCALTGRRVVVIDASGVLRVISGAGKADSLKPARDPWRRVEAWLREDVVVLFKTPGHWQRVLGVRNDND